MTTSDPTRGPLGPPLGPPAGPTHGPHGPPGPKAPVGAHYGAHDLGPPRAPQPGNLNALRRRLAELEHLAGHQPNSDLHVAILAAELDARGER